MHPPLASHSQQSISSVHIHSVVHSQHISYSSLTETFAEADFLPPKHHCVNNTHDQTCVVQLLP